MNKLILRKQAALVSDDDVKMMELLSEGHKTASVASKMGKSRRTIESRLENLRRKNGSATTLELMADFFRSGLLKIEQPANQ